MSVRVAFIILDFSKAFDKVPHQRLLRKLEQCGIRNSLHNWFKSWLIHREQKVVIDGDTSSSAPVTSDVPQGTVLGLLLFLIYINDIGSNITSNIPLFADDYVIYRTINSANHTKLLQHDLDRLIFWSHKWQMLFNSSECLVLRIYQKATDH